MYRNVGTKLTMWTHNSRTTLAPPPPPPPAGKYSNIFSPGVSNQLWPDLRREQGGQRQGLATVESSWLKEKLKGSFRSGVGYGSSGWAVDYESEGPWIEPHQEQGFNYLLFNQGQCLQLSTPIKSSWGYRCWACLSFYLLSSASSNRSLKEEELNRFSFVMDADGKTRLIRS